MPALVNTDDFCSAAEKKVLDALSLDQWTSASFLAGLVWKDLPGPLGKRSGQWQRMGALLHKLYDRGFVYRKTTPHNQRLWRRSLRPAVLRPL
jgi:hypothetical protein